MSYKNRYFDVRYSFSQVLTMYLRPSTHSESCSLVFARLFCVQFYTKVQFETNLCSSTLCLEKVPTFKLSVTLSNVNRFFKIFALLESVWNLIQNVYYTTHLTLRMSLHYLGKLKIKIFCRCSADMEETANKLHFCRLRLCYWSTNFNIFSV